MAAQMTTTTRRSSASAALAMVQVLCSSGRSHEAHHRLSLLLLSSSSSSPSAYDDDRTCNALLARLLHARTPLLTLRLLRRCLPRFTPSASNSNRLLHLLCSHHSPPLPLLAHHLLLLRHRHTPDAASCTSLLDGYARLPDPRAALQLFDEMPALGVAPNSLTRTVLIKAFLRSRDVDRAARLIAQLWPAMERSRGEEDQSVRHAAFANLIHCLCRQGLFHIVFQIAEEMPQRGSVADEFAYAQMIDSLCRAEQHHGASRIVYIMRKRGLLPSLVSYNCIVHGLSSSGRRGFRGCMRAYQLVMEGAEFGYCPPEHTYRVLLHALCRENHLAKAKDILELVLQQHAGGTDADCRTRMYNIFLSALRIVDNPSEQLSMLVSMLQRQSRPDVITLNTVIHGFCKIGRVKEARKITEDMLNGTFCPPDVVTFTTLIGGYLNVGEHAEALCLLRTLMPRCRCSPNVVTYIVVLKGLFSLGQVESAMEIFAEMKGKGIAPDSATHAAVIKGLCDAGQLEKAKMFWDDIVWPSKIHDDYVYAVIFQGLCKLGRLDRACDFLYELVDCGVAPGIICYNVLIDAACEQGLRREAYQTVKEMRRNGLAPDAVTWRILGKLHHCSIAEERSALDGNASFADDQVVLRDLEHLISTEHGIPSSEIAHEAADDKAMAKCEAGDSVEGLVDPPIVGTELAKEEEDFQINTIVRTTMPTDESTKADVLKKQPPHPLLQREPLSKLARRVYGLL